MQGKLFVVGTPIGNLSDITDRAKKTLSEVDFIAAEDTRVSLKLLNHYDIKKPLVSYHQHSTKYVSDSIISRIEDGENCAVITDAGMPCISDPGEDLVKNCAAKGIPIVVVPGPAAVISALAISGLDTSRFAFEGFLSTSKKQRYEHLESLQKDTHTLIFYEAPHKLKTTLYDILTYLGDRKISICRELTKVYEEVIRTTVKQAIEYYDVTNPKGEFVLVVEGYQKPDQPEITLEDAMDLVNNLIKNGAKPTDACKEIAKSTGFKKSELYSKLI